MVTALESSPADMASAYLPSPESVEEKTGRNIFQRMHAVMQDISYVQKGEKTVNGQYRFVGHDAVTAKVREALVAHGIVALTDVASHAQDGNRTEADVTVVFVNIDAPDDRISVRAFGYGIDPQDKGPGKAISYAVKYAYLKAFALETGDDPERDSIDHKPYKPAANPLPAAIPANIEGHDLFAALPTDAQTIVRDDVAEMTSLVKGGDLAAALAMLTEKYPSAEDQLILASQMPSEPRNKIKAYKRSLHIQPKNGADLGSQM